MAVAAAFSAPAAANAQSLTDAQRAQLQAELQQVEQEAAQAQAQLSAAQAKSASLSRDIAVLNAKIRAAELDIRAKNLLIQTLGNDISDKQSHIEDLQTSIDNSKQTIGDLLKRTYELGNTSIAQVLLSEHSVSGFFRDVDMFQSVESSLDASIQGLRSDQASTSAEKDALDKRRSAELDARHAIEVQQANIESDKQQEARLLSISKGNEKAYNEVLAEKQARAAQIRSALFALSGTKAIQFGDALSYANTVYQKTGVPPAFLLAILKQETNIGANVGTCYLTDTATGDGVNSRTQRTISNVMKPSRDVQPFLAITKALGLDYRSMPVSCPQSIGYGGGMGPAQFIASTWTLPDLMSRIQQALGITTMPDPWRPLDAFMASGIYLEDLGAGSGSYSAQRNAACKYYSGRPCGYVYGSSSYGNSVMALADSIQRNQIDPLQDNE